jgi:ribosome-associated translation inhibitor RaiA
MQTPLQVTFRGIAHSDTLVSHLQQRVDRLERIFDPIVSCHVVVELEGHQHHHGDRCRFTIHVGLPEHELMVNDAPRGEHSFEDATAKADRAFDDAESQLEQWVGRMRGRRHEHMRTST